MLRKLGLGVAIAATLLGAAMASAEDLVLRVTKAEVTVDDYSGGPALHVWLSPEARKAFADFTLEHVGDQADLVVNGDILSSPVIQTAIDTEMLVLSGLDSVKQAQDMVALLNGKKTSISVRLSAP